MSRDQYVEAVFGTTLSTTTSGKGSVIIDPAAGVYPYGYTVTLTALPQTGTRGRAFRLLLLSRHLALNQQCGANPSWAPATQEPARSTQRFSSPVLPLVF